MIIKGKIEAISIKVENNTFGFKIGPEWFNGFGKPEVNKGEWVELEFEQPEGKPWRNIKIWKKIPEPTEAEKNEMPEQPKVSPNIELDRRCSVMVAKDLLVAKGVDRYGETGEMKDALFSLAKAIEEYITKG